MTTRNDKVIEIDFERGAVTVTKGADRATFALDTPEAFEAVSRAWLRCGWDNKYVYGFTWLGRPVIQLPEDIVRIQEVIYDLKPDVIIETGVAHGGSLVYYASLCRLMEHGRVIGIDKEIRPSNRSAIEGHALAPLITLIEGDSIDRHTLDRVREKVGPTENGIVLLDSCHTKAHTLAEMRAYSEFVGAGSYIVAMDGIMEELVGAPRSKPDWIWNNPRQAALEFVRENSRFRIEEPKFLFNEGNITERVAYWPSAFIKCLQRETKKAAP